MSDQTSQSTGDQPIPDFPTDQATQYGASPGAEVASPDNPPSPADTTQQNFCINFCFTVDGQAAPWSPMPFCGPSMDAIRSTVDAFIQAVLQPMMPGRKIAAHTC